jgi:hypothetical protein
MKISAILAAAALCITGVAPLATSAADAQGYHRPPHHGYGRKKVKVCRTVWRGHHRKRVCNWRYR